MTEPDVEAWLERAMVVLGQVLRAVPQPLRLKEVDAALVDILIEHEVPVLVTDDTMNLGCWAAREPRRPLAYLAKHALGGLLGASYRLYQSDAKVRALVMSTPALSVVFDDTIRTIEALLNGATLARLDQEMEHLQGLITPDLLAMRPDLADVLGRIDVADMLARNLRGGIMDELCWPEQDRVNDGFSTDAGQYRTGGPFPYWICHHVDDGVLVVIAPEGEVYRSKLPEGVPKSARSMRYVNGDVLYFSLESSLDLARWLSDPANTFKEALWATWTVGVPTPAGHVWDGTRTLRPGEPNLAHPDIGQELFSDGATFWAKGQRFDPDTGRTLGAGLPQWLAGDDVLLKWCSYWPVAVAGSQLGVKDGQWGIRVRALAGAGPTHAMETLDGRRWTGTIPGGEPRAFFRFPHRDADVVYAYLDIGQDAIWLGDGSHPLVPGRHANFPQYWAGAPQWLPFAWWHYLVPRDLDGSAALAATTTAQARRLIDAAVGVGAGVTVEDLATDGATTATMTSANPISVLKASPAFAAALEEALPDVTHPRLKAGITAIVEQARRLQEQVEQWLQTATDTPQEVTFGLADRDVDALAKFFGETWLHTPGHFEASVRGTAAFLAEEGIGRSGYESSLATASMIRWHWLLRHSGALTRALLGPGVSAAQRTGLRAALEVWADTDFAAAPSEFRLFEVEVSPPPPGLSGKIRAINVESASRYALRAAHLMGPKVGFVAIERRRNGTFTDPAWGTMSWQEPARSLDRATILETLAALDANGPLPWDPAIGERFCALTGVMPATAALVWTGAIGIYEADTALRKALGITKADAELARWEIPRNLPEFYARAMPERPTALYAPLEDDGSGLSPVDRLAETWNAMFGKRTPLDIDTVRAMQSSFHSTTDPFALDLRALEDPDAQAFLTQDETWVVRPWDGFRSNVGYLRGTIPPGWPKHASQTTDDKKHPSVTKAFSGWALKKFLAYVPWAHQDLPFGHPVRAGLVRMCELFTERLGNPELLLLGGAVDLSLEPDPRALEQAFAALIARFDGEPYVAADGGDAADGLDRGDLVVTWPRGVKNAIFIAVRPQRVADPAAFERMARDLGIYDAFHRTGGGCTCGLNFGATAVVDITELPAWLVWQAEGFREVIAALGQSGPAGRYQSDPRVSCPALVSEARERHALSEDAATLLLQLLTLAEPTRPNVQRINGWTKKVFDAARAELLDGELAVERQYQGSPRSTFIGNDIAFCTSPAHPMEASKLALYRLEPDDRDRLRAPFGVVLPLRPLAVLFDEAARSYWARS